MIQTRFHCHRCNKALCVPPTEYRSLSKG
ncbi:TPA: hypothetical protein JW611_004750 [Escherichia coli]|nr:hypothetical protein [Escherichia coli]HAH0901673.1 hypothetical protein [Escherichia coli]HAL3302866.1 hypothetical protein [Escherichia coli]HAX2614352.1 hypothetical protein [Escherichia coli]HAX2647638.1 hypothetical protein [Escherichia coli]